MSENWSFIVAFVVPLVLAALLRCNWSDKQKALAALGFCVFVSLVTTWIADPGIFTVNNSVEVLGNVMRVAVASIIFYKGMWQKVGATEEISKRSPIT